MAYSVWGAFGTNTPTRDIFSTETLLTLRALTPPPSTLNVTINVDGGVIKGDGSGGIYFWNAGDARADNGSSIIQPNDLPTNGRWNFVLSNSASLNFLGTGVGAIPRSAQSKLQDILALTDYDNAAHYAAAVAAAGIAGSYSIPGLVSVGGMRVTGLSTAITGVGMEFRYDTTAAGTGAITVYDRTNLVYKAFALDALTHVFEIEGIAALNITTNRDVIGQHYIQGVVGVVGPLITTAGVIDLDFSTNLGLAKWSLRSDTSNFICKTDNANDIGDANHRPGKVVTTIIDTGDATSGKLRTNLGTVVLTWANDLSTVLAGTLKHGDTNLIRTSVALTNNAAAQAATITNGPTAGNPTKWIPINDNGTVRNIPAW